ncbi:hypothetical protein JZU71_02795, partial [bacterium]|nr:hypothetical protein [bacterium]
MNLIARRPTLKVNCFLNQWEDATQVSGTILRNLERLTDRLPLLSTIIHHNPDFANAFSYGVGAIECSPGSEAATEIIALYTELKHSK